MRSSVFALCLSLLAVLQPLHESPVYAQPQPVAGAPYSLHYISRGTEGFVGQDSLKLLYVFDFWNVRYGTRLALWTNVLRPDTAQLQEATLRKADGGWGAVIDIPADAALLSYVVTDGEVLDGNSERTYTQYVVDAQGRPVRNARYYNVQFLRLAKVEFGEILHEAEMEILSYPDNFPAYHQYFSLMLEQEKGSPRVQQRIVAKMDELAKSYGADAEFLNMAARTWFYLLKDTETAMDYRARIPLDRQWPEVLRMYDRDAQEQERSERSTGMKAVRDKLIGAPLPAFQLRTYNGEKVSFPVEGASPTLLCFWMKHSDKCREMLRDLGMMSRSYDGQVRMYAVGVDRDMAEASAWLAEHPLSFPALHNQGSTLFQLGVESVPTTFLLDNNNIVRHVHVGYGPGVAASLKSDIDALLEKK